MKEMYLVLLYSVVVLGLNVICGSSIPDQGMSVHERLSPQALQSDHFILRA